MVVGSGADPASGLGETVAFQGRLLSQTAGGVKSNKKATCKKKNATQQVTFLKGRFFFQKGNQSSKEFQVPKMGVLNLIRLF